MPDTPVKCTVDVAMPAGILDALGAAFAVKNLGDILINQVSLSIPLKSLVNIKAR